jgi:hypothetical protein
MAGPPSAEKSFKVLFWQKPLSGCTDFNGSVI